MIVTPSIVDPLNDATSLKATKNSRCRCWTLHSSTKRSASKNQRHKHNQGRGPQSDGERTP